MKQKVDEIREKEKRTEAGKTGKTINMLPSSLGLARGRAPEEEKDSFILKFLTISDEKNKLPCLLQVSLLALVMLLAQILKDLRNFLRRETLKN